MSNPFAAKKKFGRAKGRKRSPSIKKPIANVAGANPKEKEKELTTLRNQRRAGMGGKRWQTAQDKPLNSRMQLQKNRKPPKAQKGKSKCPDGKNLN